MSIIIKIVEVVATFGFIACFLADSFLIILTHFIIKRNFGSYKWLITIFASSGILFALVENFVTPIQHNFNSGFAFFTTKKPFNTPKWLMEIFLSVYGGFFSMTISILAVQCIYRYFALFRQVNHEKLVYFAGLKMILWVCYPLTFGALWTVSSHLLGASDEFSDGYLQGGIYDFYGVNLTTIPYLAVIAHDNTDPLAPKLHLKSCGFALTSCLISGFQYTIMIYCGYHMQKEVKSKTLFTSKVLRRLHRQFFKALVLQIITPSVVLFLPIIFTFVVPFLNIKISFPTAIFVGLFTIYPAMDALILIYIVSDYSKAIKTMITRMRTAFTKEKTSSVAVTEQSHI